MTDAQPSVSTLVKCLTMALWRAIFCTPMDSIMVTMAGSPSGMAATASETEVRNISANGIPRSRENTRSSAQMTSAAFPSSEPIRVSRSCKGVLPFSSSCSSAAMRPTFVSMPVATATALPLPPRMAVLEKTMFRCSERCRFSPVSSAAVLDTAADSPLSDDSSVSSSLASSTRASAGTK